MTDRAWDYVIVGGGSAGQRARQPPERRPVHPRPRPRGRPARLAVRRLHPHAGGADVPDRQPVLRLAYESEPEPFMNGRRIYHARGKVLGGVELDQRDDLPARQPARLRALGGRSRAWRPGTSPTACRTSSGWRTAPRPRPTIRGAATAVRSGWSAARRRAPCSGPGSRPPSRPATRSRPTSTAIARRASPRSTGTSGAAAGSAPRGPISTRSCGRPNLKIRTSTLVTRIHFEGRRAVGVEIERQGGGTETIRAGEVILARRRVQHAAAPPAVGGRRRRRARRRSGSRSWPTCPASASTSRTTSRSTSSTARASRSRCSRRRPRNGGGRSSAPSGCSCGAGPGATNHFEGGGFVRSNEDVAYPNLMFHFLPLAIRYDGTPRAERPRLPGPRRADVLRRPRAA